jgi:hypothetical protein
MQLLLISLSQQFQKKLHRYSHSILTHTVQQEIQFALPCDASCKSFRCEVIVNTINVYSIMPSIWDPDPNIPVTSTLR